MRDTSVKFLHCGDLRHLLRLQMDLRRLSLFAHVEALLLVGFASVDWVVVVDLTRYWDIA